MGVHGTLCTMALPDLLQWAGVNRKSGVLQLERNGVQRRIVFRMGRIAACGTNDPTLLAHYLLSSGRITSEQLHQALDRQQACGKPLPTVISEMGLLSEAEVAHQLALRAEETIYSLFEWVDADFDFDEDRELDASYVRVSVDVDEILLNGLQRVDEMKMIRHVFQSSGIVLARTGTAAPAQIANSAMARRILDAIDGRRTLAEILAQAQVSEFLVLKFLYHLYHKETLRVAEVRTPPPGATTLLDAVGERPTRKEDSAATPHSAKLDDARVQVLAAAAMELEGGLGAKTRATPAAASGATTSAAAVDDVGDVTDAIFADLLGETDDPQAAPGREAAAAQGGIPAAPANAGCDTERVPVLLQPAEQLLNQNLAAEEMVLTSLIDGHATLAAIIGMAPFDETTVVETLRGMQIRGLVEMRSVG